MKTNLKLEVDFVVQILDIISNKKECSYLYLEDNADSIGIYLEARLFRMMGAELIGMKLNDLGRFFFLKRKGRDFISAQRVKEILFTENTKKGG